MIRVYGKLLFILNVVNLQMPCFLYNFANFSWNRPDYISVYQSF